LLPRASRRRLRRALVRLRPAKNEGKHGHARRRAGRRLIGSQFGGGTAERIAAGIGGAAIGGLIGNRIGAGRDDDDKRRAYAAQMQALEAGKSGVAVAWKNPDSGRYGSVVPGPAYESNGLQCRPYTHTIYIDGRPQVARGNACRNPDGTWTAVG
jgi:surface antigen